MQLRLNILLNQLHPKVFSDLLVDDLLILDTAVVRIDSTKLVVYLALLGHVKLDLTEVIIERVARLQVDNVFIWYALALIFRGFERNWVIVPTTDGQSSSF